MKGAEAAAKVLPIEGTKQVFTFPDDPPATPCGGIGIKPYLAKTERTAIAMADAYTRIKNWKEMRSGRPALLEMITVPMPKYGAWGRRGLGYTG